MTKRNELSFPMRNRVYRTEKELEVNPVFSPHSYLIHAGESFSKILWRLAGGVFALLIASPVLKLFLIGDDVLHFCGVVYLIGSACLFGIALIIANSATMYRGSSPVDHYYWTCTLIVIYFFPATAFFVTGVAFLAA